MEVVAIVAVAVLGVIALGGVVALVFKASNFQRVPTTEEPKLSGNGQELMKVENPSKNELAEINEVQLERILAYGAKVAAVTVSRSGANPPWLTELSGQ